MRFYLALFCFLITISNFYGQTIIKGTVLDDNNTPLNRVRVFVRHANSSKYTFTNPKGQYSISFDAKADSPILVIAEALNFKSDSIKLSSVQNILEINFKLKPKLKSIEEVVIQGKRKPTTTKKDTLIYHAENFIDQTDKTVEDLLKKLPGITVNDNGSIEYKGKTVAAVMLDGSDLFKSNYTIGTRSINPNIIDQVQAIEHWSDNPILKGLNAENKVALNLKLKKNKASFSSNLNAETDFVDRYNLGAYALLVSSGIKTFGTTNANNTGVNKSPTNYSTNNLGLDDYLNMKLQSPEIIQSKTVNSQFGDEKANRNRQWFSSSNTAFKLNDKLHININGNLMKDRISIDDISERNYNYNHQNILQKDENSSTKRPVNLMGEMDVKWYKSPKEYLTFSSTLHSFSEKTDNSFLTNSERSYHSEINKENLFSKNELIYTRKIRKKEAFQTIVLYTYNQKPQQFWISPALELTNQNASSNTFQDVFTNKKHFSVDLIHHLVFSENHKLKTSLSYTNERFSLNSNLYENHFEIVENFQNNLQFKTNTVGVNIDYYIKKNGWDITFNQHNSLASQELSNPNSDTKNSVLNSSKLFIYKYLFHKFSLFLNGDITTTPIDFKYLFDNNILVSNRSFVRNKYSLDPEKMENYTLGIVYNDNLRNQFTTSLSTSYLKNKNKFVSEYSVDSNWNNMTYQQVEKPTESYSLSLNVEKYIAPIVSRFNIKLNYIRSNYFSMINQSNLSELNTRTFNTNIIHQFALGKNLKIKTLFDYSMTNFSSELGNNSELNIMSFKNTISYTFLNNKVSTNLSNEYYKPDTKQSVAFLFTNFNLYYSPKNSRLKYNFTANNILNEEYIYSKYTHDYMTLTYKTKLLSRSFLFGVNLSL
ncbi:carboxypeptidase-like regulatory domain-containing protein [Amniculibacterium sp. G2-70]|uniref:carboxypeptidase-like regulatory domain-containing protein n=1 Tax=Amniculibacterium sp. G2-70 TaxID=2767188 RepID=UPI0016545C2A|nr:carboxypeptidase-like regulatory domain-containing protein [Amniculibacterium sp. G2-70]